MKRALLAVFSCVLWTSSADAQTSPSWSEIGDAGDLPGSAQVTSGFGSLTSITGALTPGISNPDLYLINVITPAFFSATTLFGTGVDTQLFLFSVSGLGIAANDNAPGSMQSTLTAVQPLFAGFTPGPYLLGISGFNNDPLSSGGLIFPDLPSGMLGPTGPGGGSLLSSWTGVGATGAYTILLTGCSPLIPAPPSMALLALAALAGPKRRRG